MDMDLIKGAEENTDINASGVVGLTGRKTRVPHVTLNATNAGNSDILQSHVAPVWSTKLLHPRKKEKAVKHISWEK